MARARMRADIRCAMSTARIHQVVVLLVGLPGFYEWLLRRELAAEQTVIVQRFENREDPDDLLLDEDAVIVTGAAPRSLRTASELLSRQPRILGIVAVTDDEPGGDAYLVRPAGPNVTSRQLAEVIREVVAEGRAGRRTQRSFLRGLIRSKP